MREGLTRRGLGRLTLAEWLVVLLCGAALIAMIVSTSVEVRRQATARNLLSSVKAARLASFVVSAEKNGLNQPFSDFTSPTGFAGGVAEEIQTLAKLPGEVRLLQTDEAGYEIRQLSYREGEVVAVYDAAGSWTVYDGRTRIMNTFSADS